MELDQNEDLLGLDNFKLPLSSLTTKHAQKLLQTPWKFTLHLQAFNHGVSIHFPPSWVDLARLFTIFTAFALAPFEGAPQSCFPSPDNTED
jgi:hypothetical protein